MSSRVEQIIENKVSRWARKQNIITLKLNPMGNRGWPDRLYILQNGKLLFIEFKRPGALAYPLQQAVHRKLKRRGQLVEVFDDPDAAISWIESFMDPEGVPSQGDT